MDSCEFQQQFLPKNYTYSDVKLDYRAENDFEVEFHVSVTNLTGKTNVAVD